MQPQKQVLSGLLNVRSLSGDDTRAPRLTTTSLLSMTNATSKGLLLSFCAAGVLAGCAMTPMGPSVQVMPGPGKTFDAFQADNNACKFFAADSVKGQADVANQRAVAGAVFTTVLGAGLGAATGALAGDAGGGAAAGAALGAGSGVALGTGNSSNDQLGIQAQYDNAFSQCMYAKGEQVPGFTPVPMAPTTSSSDAPAPSPLIRSTQRELIRLGYLNDVADGYSGPKTRSAIANYQQSIGMSPDGEASSRLLAKLQATPSGGATATASAPSTHVSDWVAPASTAASPSSGWVTPAGGGSAAPASGASAWVAPKAQ